MFETDRAPGSEIVDGKDKACPLQLSFGVTANIAVAFTNGSSEIGLTSTI